VIADLLGLDGSDVGMMQQLADGCRLDLVALTKGERGSVLLSGGESVVHPGCHVEVADTVGAGDAFTAALTVGLLRGLPLEHISTVANRLAAFVCTRSGATPEIPPELACLLD